MTKATLSQGAPVQRRAAILLSCCCLALASFDALAAPINVVPASTLTSPDIETFAGATKGDIDTIYVRHGVRFAERFSGQSISTGSRYEDVLSGLPTAPLTLVAGAPGQNLILTFGHNHTEVVSGHGVTHGTGEGAIAMLFDVGQFELGFWITGSTPGGPTAASALVSFYRWDGSLIDSVSLTPVTDGNVAFRREGNKRDIRGLTITNDDIGGIGFDNIRFAAVPEPSTGLLVSLGLIGLARRRA